MVTISALAGINYEGTHHDLKRSFDPIQPKAILDLVKDIVAIANSGGGQLIYGCTDTEIVGLSDEVCSALDSAKVADQVDKYIAPSSVQLTHEIREPEPGKRILVLSIETTSFPLIISKDGAWMPVGKKYDEVVLRKGDVWVRHSSKNERATFEDVRGWLMAARTAERAAIFERMAMLVNLPEGSSLEVVTRSGSHIDTPTQLIQSAQDRRKWDPGHLLSADDLLWIFAQRTGLTLLDSDLKILIASSLRKSATLHYWITLAEHDPALIVDELKAALSADDRDKSDAGGNVAELASFYADDTTLRQIIEGLRNSVYSHFREAAEAWQGRVKAQHDSFNRANSASHEGRPLNQYNHDELEQFATELASLLARRKSSSLSRTLSNVNRVIWARRTGRGAFLQSTLKKKK